MAELSERLGREGGAIDEGLLVLGGSRVLLEELEGTSEELLGSEKGALDEELEVQMRLRK